MGLQRESVIGGESFERGCNGKENHPTESAALAALQTYQRLGRFRTGSGVEPYFCRACGDWHLGHVRVQAARPRSGPQRSEFPSKRADVAVPGDLRPVERAERI